MQRRINSEWNPKKIPLFSPIQTEQLACVAWLDNAHPFPEQLRKESLAYSYQTEGNSPIRKAMIEEVEPSRVFLESCLGVPIRSLEARFQYLPRCDENRVFCIHCDPKQWSAVLYLNEEHENFDGTGFFKHRFTGMSRTPSPAESIMLSKVLQLPLAEVVERSGKERLALDCWEPQLIVPWKFNRLVVFPGYLYHRPCSTWGEGLEDGRLAQVFNFDTDEAPLFMRDSSLDC